MKEKAKGEQFTEEYARKLTKMIVGLTSDLQQLGEAYREDGNLYGLETLQDVEALFNARGRAVVGIKAEHIN